MKITHAVTKEEKIVKVARLSPLGTMKALPLPTAWVRWYAKQGYVIIEISEDYSIIIKPCPELMDEKEMEEYAERQKALTV